MFGGFAKDESGTNESGTEGFKLEETEGFSSEGGSRKRRRRKQKGGQMKSLDMIAGGRRRRRSRKSRKSRKNREKKVSNVAYVVQEELAVIR